MNSKRMQINSKMKWGRQCRIWKRHSVKIQKSWEKSNWNSGNENLNKSNFKILVGSLTNWSDQVEDIISEFEDKIDELEYSDNNKWKKVWMEHIRPLGHH
jgi:hypothetical protein